MKRGCPTPVSDWLGRCNPAHNEFITAPQFVALESTDTLVDAIRDGRQESVGGEERTT